MDGQWPVTRIVRNLAPVASEFDWIPSPEATVFVLAPGFWWLLLSRRGTILPSAVSEGSDLLTGIPHPVEHRSGYCGLG